METCVYILRWTSLERKVLDAGHLLTVRMCMYVCIHKHICLHEMLFSPQVISALFPLGQKKKGTV